MLAEKNQSLQIANASDWDLVVKVCHWNFQLINMTKAEWSKLYCLVYQKSDGYGVTGFVPSQGYDWSGIRDSTPSAKSAMAQVIRDYCEEHGILGLFYKQRVA